MGNGPLTLLIDSTGINAESKGEWNARKHGGRTPRIWRKMHIGIDEATLEVRAIEVTTGNVGDAPMLQELLSQIPSDQEIGSMTGDGPTTRANATTRWPPVALTQSFCRARMPSRGNRQAPGLSPETKP